MAGRIPRSWLLSLFPLVFCGCSDLTAPHDEAVTPLPEPVASVAAEPPAPPPTAPAPSPTPAPAPPPEVSIAHILISYKGAKNAPAKVGKRTKAQAQKLADDLARRAAKEDFGKLSKAYSDDALTAAKGGELGSPAPGRVPNAVIEAGRTLAPGAVSSIDAEDGFHVLKRAK